MFSRQWFPPDSQVGISKIGLDFEYLLRSKKYDTALKICINNIKNEKNYWKRQYKRLMHLVSLYFTSIHTRQKKIYIYFNGFWPDFDVKEIKFWIFKCFIKRVKCSYHTSEDIQSSDILIESCYDLLYHQNEHLTKILFLGENVRPFFSNYDYSISFDRSSMV